MTAVIRRRAPKFLLSPSSMNWSEELSEKRLDPEYGWSANLQLSRSSFRPLLFHAEGRKEPNQRGHVSPSGRGVTLYSGKRHGGALALGQVSLYTARGDLQLYVQSMEPRGQGALYLAFEQLKKKLAQEGLFNEQRKRPLPVLPNRSAS